MTTIKHPRPVSLAQSQSQIQEHWQPECILTANGDHSFKLATVSGNFIWHSHPDTDEVFYCVSGGPLILDIATNTATRHENQGIESHSVHVGEIFKVPRGYRHRPRAERDTGILMIEKVGTVNTGDEQDSREGKMLTVQVAEGK